MTLQNEAYLGKDQKWHMDVNQNDVDKPAKGKIDLDDGCSVSFLAIEGGQLNIGSSAKLYSGKFSKLIFNVEYSS